MSLKKKRRSSIKRIKSHQKQPISVAFFIFVQMLKIGITGSIGSGKSIISQIFKHLGIPVYDADSRAKSLMNHSTHLRNDVIALLGNQAYENGILNRAYIAEKVFGNAELLNKLNGIIHPAVFLDFENWCEGQKNASYIIKEAALMFESESYKQLDQIITVTAPQRMRIDRVIKRDHMSETDIVNRMNKQLSQDEKLKRSQYEVVNDETVLLIPQVLKLHQLFLSMAKLQNSPEQQEHTSR